MKLPVNYQIPMQLFYAAYEYARPWKCPVHLKAIARAGAGVNNIPVSKNVLKKVLWFSILPEQMQMQ
jgi:hypothetical protein